MRIMYLTQWFEPEPNIVKGVAFVRALQGAGHEVTVVTGLPNYPTGKLYPGYRLSLIQHEMIDGVRVVRLPLYPSHDSSSLRRSLNFLSFFASALLYCLLRRERYDLAYVYHPPIMVGLAAALAGKVRRLPFVLDVQDLWPDTIAATGMAGGRSLEGTLGALCRFVYSEADAIVVQSHGMRRALIERGVPGAKLNVIRNWADVDEAEPSAERSIRTKDRFTIVYGGNFGRAQGLETVVAAAAIIERYRQDIEIILYGDGVEAAALQGQALAQGVTCLRFEERLGKDRIIPIFREADALLLHLANDPLFEITIPSKTQFYLAMGRPIVAGIAGEAAEMLAESGAAMVAAPGDAAALARAIVALAELPRKQREIMGGAGLAYYRERLSFDEGIGKTLEVLEGTYARKQSTGPGAPS